MPATPSLEDRIIEGLSKPQRDAVLSTARYTRIVASAGAGKTETITRKVVYLIGRGAEPAEIVAFTFTERAAAEMKARIYRRIDQLLGPNACKKLGDMYIGTIHAFCLRLLQDEFGYGNYDVLDENQEMAFLMRHGWAMGLGKSGNYSANCERFQRSLNVVYDELLDRSRLETDVADFTKDISQYEEVLDQHRLLTFGRMILLAVDELENNRSISDRFKHLIVDEYQDINRAQEKLIHLIARESECHIVGDPRQCIYQWRGSDPSCFDRFAEAFHCETIPIMENRRSVPEIVVLGNHVASNFEEINIRAPMTPIRKDGGIATHVAHETDVVEAEWIAAQAEHLKESGTCQYSDIAVLLRSVRTSGPKIVDALKRRSLPYLVGGKVGLFQRDEARAVGQLFVWCADAKWKMDPYTNDYLEGEALFQAALAAWPTKAAAPALRRFREDIRAGKFHNLTQAYQGLLVILEAQRCNPTDPTMAARLANLGRFNTLLTDYEASLRRGGSRANWPSDLTGLAWFIGTYALGAYEEQPAEDLRGINAVQVMTVHQAKGLEWPIVFVPALTSKRFPSTMAGRSQQWEVPSTLCEQKRYEGSENDERKLFYVAVTRARDALCLSRFRRIKNSQSPSLFLAESEIGCDAPPEKPFVSQIRSPASSDEEIIGFTASEIIVYLRCPHLYRLREVWGFQPGLVKELGFGTSVHHVLRLVAEHAKAGRDPLASLSDVLEEEFHLPYSDPQTSVRLRSAAEKALREYVKAHKDELRRIDQVEARLEFPLTKTAVVSGRVDVIIGSLGDVEVRDYKTADDPRTQEEAEVQIRLYALGLGEIGQPVSRASLAFVMDNNVKPVSLEPSVLAEARASAQRAVEGILAARYDAQSCSYCGSCDYRVICYSRGRE